MKDAIDSQGCEVIISATRNGLKIKMIYDPKSSTITTAFPIIDKTL
jgi:hypothetical protein